MFETLAAVAIGAGFIMTIKLITGSDAGEAPLAAALTMPKMLPRPRGVQETDLAPFVFRGPESAAARATNASSAGRVRTIEPCVETARAA